VQATVDVHRTVGVAATTIVEVARRAGVTRETVYRHFKDEVALTDASSSYWLQHEPPDPSSWERVAGPAERLGIGLGELYRFYGLVAQMPEQLHRDFERLPEHHQVALRRRADMARAALLSSFPPAQRRSPVLGAMVGHAASFQTWRTLRCEFCLSESDATELMVEAALLTAGRLALPRPPDGGRPRAKVRAPQTS
jgi:AcrR family transcriptional regulator